MADRIFDTYQLASDTFAEVLYAEGGRVETYCYVLDGDGLKIFESRKTYNQGEIEEAIRAPFTTMH